jgi:clan AA aspartic protease (TIGR02281 family)
MRQRWVLLALAMGLALIGAEAAGEIYKWTDASGKVHFTHDLNQVPARHRAAAEAAAKAPKGRDPIQTYTPPPAARRPAARPSTSSVGGPKPTYRIKVQRAGTSMRVVARLNDRVNVPFIIDTGASDVVVPKRFVTELGIDLRGARTGRYSTANGVIETQLITLESVELGGARAAQVPATVSDSMPIGLLGLSYFNRFNYKIDTAQGIVTLVPNDLEDTGLIRGGRSESDWRSSYAQLRWRMRSLEEKRDRVPSSRSRAHARMKEEMEELERQHRQLESEADEARVPFSWRE